MDYRELPHDRADDCVHAGLGKACWMCRERFTFEDEAFAEGRALITKMLESAGASDDIQGWFPVGFLAGAIWARSYQGEEEAHEEVSVQEER